MITFEENKLDLNTYLYLRESVQWILLSDEQAQRALDNSIYTVCAYKDGQPVAMGRIVGDGAVICYVQDLVVHPDVQSLNIGREVMNKLIQYVESLKIDNTQIMLGLMCAKGREKFYEHMGFTPRPTDNLGPGMIMYIR